jgi:hypothetical protein
MIKLKDIVNESKYLKKILEQAERKDLPAVTFDNIFNDNYITPIAGSWQPQADKLVQDIKSYLDKGWDLEDLQIQVHGGASKPNATKRWNNKKEQNPPEHTFGGKINPEDWIAIYVDGKYIGNPTSADVVKGGNDWLADERANVLFNLLSKHISTGIGQKLPKQTLQITSAPNTEKIAQAKIISSVRKFQTKKFPFRIEYKWYKIGNSNPLVLIDNQNTPGSWRTNKADSISSKWLQQIKSDTIPYAGFQKRASDPKQFGIRGTAYIQINPDNFDGVFANYNDYDKWWADVQKIINVSPVPGGSIRVGDTNSKEVFPDSQGATGYISPGKDNGLANFVKSQTDDKLIRETKPFYLFKPESESPKLISDIFPNEMAKQQIPSHLRDVSYFGEEKISRRS